MEFQASESELPEMMISATAVKDRGWTDALIKQFMSSPDKTALNPMYASAAPVRLYSVSRIESIETGEAFLAAMAVSAKRKDAAKKAAETKRAKLLEQIEALEIHVIELSPDEILSKAIESFNEFRLMRDTATLATPDSEKDFLDRIQVNFIRHNLTSYDDEIHEVAGKVGSSDAYDLIRTKVFAAIRATYPQFAWECLRQLSPDPR